MSWHLKQMAEMHEKMQQQWLEFKVALQKSKQEKTRGILDAIKKEKEQ